MFPFRIFNKIRHFINPFVNLFSEGFEKEGSSPAIADVLLQENFGDILQEDEGRIFLEGIGDV